MGRNMTGRSGADLEIPVPLGTRVTDDETDEPIDNPPPSPEEAAAFDAAMKQWMTVPPRERPPLINGWLERTGGNRGERGRRRWEGTSAS